MPDGAVLFLSVAKYHAPSGAIIQDTAVTPNVEVSEGGINGMPLPPPTAVTKPGAPAQATAPAAPAPDDQLQKALSLLKAQTA
jgi:C-terminal processing protease CtpA/Prc